MCQLLLKDLPSKQENMQALTHDQTQQLWSQQQHSYNLKFNNRKKSTSATFHTKFTE